MKRKNNKSNEFLTAIALIVIGVLFLFYKGEIISIAMSLIGATLIVLGILDILRKRTTLGVIKLVFAALVMLAGWLFIKLALYILGAFLLVAGITELRGVLGVKYKKYTLPVILHIAQPVIYILVAICLFFNQGGAISWVFTVSGLFLVIDGIAGIIGAMER
jgi:uncharacterized membrane protein HdeD (DUF308 family)